MAKVFAPPHVQTQVAMETAADRRLGILLGALIRAANDLSVSGPEKHDAVKRALMAELFGGVADPDDMRAWLRELQPWDGPAGWMAERAIGLLPIEAIVDRLLGTLIRTTYQALKRVGALADQ